MSIPQGMGRDEATWSSYGHLSSSSTLAGSQILVPTASTTTYYGSSMPCIILLSKVTVALYVFIKWWSGGKRLLPVVILLFIFGILKFMEKPWSLWRGSYDRVVVSKAKSLRAEQQGQELSLAQYVRLANVYVPQQDEEEAAAAAAEHDGDNFCLKMFADVPAPYSRRLRELRSFMELDNMHAYEMLQRCHDDTFNILYTNMRYTVDPVRREEIKERKSLLSFLAWHIELPAIVLFAAVEFTMNHKNGSYSENDVRVTYIILWCTGFLEFTRFVAVALQIQKLVAPEMGTYRDFRENGILSQYSLMSLLALKKKPTLVMKLATFNCVQKFLYEHWCIGEVTTARQITEVVRQYITDGWSLYIRDAASYKVLNNCRGQWSVHRLVSGSEHRQRLGQSFKVSFDESILLWHIATDLCFHHTDTSPPCRHDDTMQRSRQISNYMFYLLSIRPEMLMPGTRPDLPSIAGDDVDRIFKDSETPLNINNKEMLARKIMDKMKSAAISTSAQTAGTMIPDACRLAEVLMELGDEKERWQLIQGVWVEMLCYAAARCRGYLHAKSLGDGGEYLSYVWLLWAFMGMETLADKTQRPEPLGEEEISAAATPALALDSPSQGRVRQTVGITISSPV